VLAARLADVLARDADPLVLLRLEEHFLDQPAVALLGLGPLAERPARGLQALGQLVAHLLELREREHARASGRGIAAGKVEPVSRPARAEQGPELRFQLGDLVEKRAAGGAFVDAGGGARDPRPEGR
jgi:hypothetical protein